MMPYGLPFVRRSLIARLLAASALALVVLTTCPVPTFAHALLEKSTPATGGQLDSPGQILASFSEAVEPQFSELQVLDANRKRVDLGDSQGALGDPKSLTVSVPKLPDATYLVAWRTLSAVDGHVVRGVFPVVVGAGGIDIADTDAPAFVPAAQDVLARWVGYAAALLLAGGFIFRLLVVGPSLRRVPGHLALRLLSERAHARLSR